MIAAETRRAPRLLPVLAIALSAALAVVGCSGPEDDGTLPDVRPISPTPSATEDAASREARAAVLLAYDGYRKAVLDASLKGDYDSKAFPKYMAEPLLGQTRNSLYQMSRAGLISRGTETWSPTVATLDLGSAPPTAVIEDCGDISGLSIVVKKTGKAVPAPTGRPTRYVVTSKAKLVSGVWYIAETSGDWGRAC